MATMPIEWGKVREYARATGADRPVYVDDPHAPIPPTFLATVVFWERIGETVRAPEVAAVCAENGIELDVRNLLSLEQEYVFHGAVPRAGETLTTSEHLRDVQVKQGRSGPMVLVRFEVSFHGQDGTLWAQCFYTSAYLRREHS